MTIRFIRNGEESVWNDFVFSRPESLPGHRIEWREILAQSLGHKPRYLVAEESERITGVLPLVRVEGLIGGRSLVSLPWLDIAGPLSSEDATRSALVQHAVDLGREEKCRYVEIRSPDNLGEPKPIKSSKMLLILPLKEPDLMWKDFTAKVRNQIRKGERSGLHTTIGGAERIDEFYDVFSRNMRDIGVPVWGIDFFRAIAAGLGGDARVLIVREGKSAVGACILIKHGTTALVPCASSLRSHFGKCPNHVLYWAALQQSFEMGARLFDFGRSSEGSGTYRFKKQWGAVRKPIFWHYALHGLKEIPERNTQSRKLQLMVKAWKRLPLPLARYLGPRIVRRIP